MDYERITRAIDINSSYLGVSTLQLMENAGRAIAEEAGRFKRIALFCGNGNNGGDGLVAARHLSAMGKEVKVYILDGNRTEANSTNLEILRNLGSVDIEVVEDTSKPDLKDFDLIIDALLGVGIKGELREPVKSLVDVMNKARAPILSVDIPTPGVEADTTLSFHIPKTQDAKVADIGIPKEAETQCGPGDVLTAIPRRKGNEHKGEFGRVLVVGGSREFTGAPVLTGKAALRTGVDLVTIMCPSYVAERIPFDPNLMVTPLNSEFYLGKEDINPILEKEFDSIIIGNGLSQQQESKYALKKLLRNLGEKRVVLDADALKLVKPSWLRENFILTPHEREFQILFGEPGETLEDKIEAVEKKARKIKATIVLKNPIDIISNGMETKLNNSGNAAMTVGGTGDALAGIIGAFHCWVEPLQAACAGAFLCGVAGDLALNDLSYAIMATDLIDKIPAALKFCSEFE
ncbi:MAG: NAD(P)H-hydrate dehydratase [Candidatus Altiarchaeota archaeon]|nr:NAD(P)H-hydrate dehydratase [Candidatus Altiarchaeota archaeon]